jgi:hypothetical protein
MSKITSLFILCFFSCAACFAAELPTPPSKPIPSIRTTQNTDVVLTEKVQAKIKKTSALKNQPVSAASHLHVITLQGSVETKAQEKAAISAARSVPGVKKVISQLTVTVTNRKTRKK